jgi:uncharacterized membrane protein YphA (DoxX/SURF4 family)
VLGLLALAAGALVLLGFLTPALAATVAVATAAHTLAQPTTGTLLSIAIALALSCLGPGAWSVDARLFGRREIVIPPDPDR